MLWWPWCACRRGARLRLALRGLGPVLAGAFTVLLLGQAGVPFTGGFVAKLGVLAAAVDGRTYWVAMVAMVGFAGFEATFALLVERRFPEVGDPTVYGLFASIGLMMVFVQARIVGPANARLGTRSTLRTSLVLVAAGMVVLAAGGGWAGLAVALVLLGRILGPLLAGLLFDRVGVEAPYLVAAALALAALALVRRADR